MEAMNNETEAYRQSARYLLFDPESPGLKAVLKWWDEFASAMALEMGLRLDQEIMGGSEIEVAE